MIPARLAHQNMKKAQQRAVELLEQLGLQERLNHRGVELSGGEQQRAAVARALINDPELILADEPTGNLDSQTGEKLLTLFRTLVQDHTVIMITHNEALCSRADPCVLYRTTYLRCLHPGEQIQDFPDIC